MSEGFSPPYPFLKKFLATPLYYWMFLKTLICFLSWKTHAKFFNFPRRSMREVSRGVTYNLHPDKAWTSRKHNVNIFLITFTLYGANFWEFSLPLQLWIVNCWWFAIFSLFTAVPGDFCFFFFCPFKVRHMEMCANLFHASMIHYSLSC